MGSKIIGGDDESLSIQGINLASWLELFHWIMRAKA